MFSVIKLMEKFGLVKIIRDEDHEEWVLLLTDLEVHLVYPEYMIENICRDILMEKLSPELALYHLEILSVQLEDFRTSSYYYGKDLFDSLYGGGKMQFLQKMINKTKSAIDKGKKPELLGLPSRDELIDDLTNKIEAYYRTLIGSSALEDYLL